ncbi:MAG TPA: MXAN_6640 family putative metalloprotease, partial [Actinomycetota bacterium]|nr:MXAN_6640 family putative metalloprotease [Actinomycetota bacterium]
TRWTLVALAAALAFVLSIPASAAAGPWDRAPRTAQADPTARQAKPLPAFAPAERDALTRALDRGRIDPATYALERARALFDLHAVRSRYGDVSRADPRGATMILRDLVLRLDELTPAQRRQAHAILARPTDAGDADEYTTTEETPICSVNGCVHYVATTDDAPDLTDTTPANGIPDYVDTTLATLDEVWQTEVTDYGYREPKSDDTSTNDGGSALIDVYIGDVGADGLYGYCTTDDPNSEPGSGYQFWDFSAYCVVDNDFSPGQFPGVSGLDALRVTMAHEFFHAVQFAYDAGEDRWFMESSATWIEDEVYDTINDNWQYLPKSPIEEPHVPLDSNNRFNVYGDWVFHRFFAESAPGANPVVIRSAWEYADGSAVGPDKYSLKAIEAVVQDLGAKFRWMFADFGMWNDVPAAVYEEGADYGFAPFTDAFKITRSRSGASGSTVLDHLTSRYFWFVPGRGVQDDAKLFVTMNGPAYKTGPEASVVVLFKSGNVQFKPLGLNKAGEAGIVVKFGRGKVAEVDLVLTNASIRRATQCWTDNRWRYACAATPKDDDMRYAFAADLIQ